MGHKADGEKKHKGSSLAHTSVSLLLLQQPLVPELQSLASP